MNEYRKTKNGVTSRMMSGQIDKSKRRGHVAPSYDLKELRDFLYLQTNFNELYDLWVDSCYDKWKRPTCDRLDDSKSYYFDNIQVLTWRENDDKAMECQRLGLINTSIPLKPVTNMINYYISVAEASRGTGLSIASISMACNGKRKTAGGFKWKFT